MIGNLVRIMFIFALGMALYADNAIAASLNGNYSGTLSFVSARSSGARCYTKAEWPSAPISLKSVKVTGTTVRGKYWNGAKWINVQGSKLSKESLKVRFRYTASGWLFVYDIILSSIRPTTAKATLKGTTSAYQSACLYFFKGSVTRS